MDVSFEGYMRFYQKRKAHYAAILKRSEDTRKHLPAAKKRINAIHATDRRLREAAELTSRLEYKVSKMRTSTKLTSAQRWKSRASANKLRKLQALTERKLKALVDTVDKIFRKDGHGQRSS
ncbi:MAG TPA: hypothetical protein VFL79_02325 [Terriglobia bacterium]|nr:hypothetical protein [Terriglobia bacterium]